MEKIEYFEWLNSPTGYDFSYPAGIYKVVKNINNTYYRSHLIISFSALRSCHISIEHLINDFPNGNFTFAISEINDPLKCKILSKEEAEKRIIEDKI